MYPIIANGLVVWEPQDLVVRNIISQYIITNLERASQDINKAWTFHQIDAPTLMHRKDINVSYTIDDIMPIEQQELTLRPETTLGSYLYAKDIIEKLGTRHSLPMCVFQQGKSYRNEQDKTLHHMRLKEFYQLEFQFIYDKSTKANYPLLLQDKALKIIQHFFSGKFVTLESSDRLPTYSEETIDIVIDELEICSMSKRKDFLIEHIDVFEIAFGLDRLVALYNNFSKER